MRKERLFLRVCLLILETHRSFKTLVEFVVSQRLGLPGILCDLYYFACLVKNLQTSRETRFSSKQGDTRLETLKSSCQISQGQGQSVVAKHNITTHMR